MKMVYKFSGIICLCISFAISLNVASAFEIKEPLKVLLVVGGGYHDYKIQKDLISKGLEARANIKVTVAYTPTDFKTELVSEFDGYKGDNWAEGYDVIIHDICSAKSDASQFVKRVAQAHEKGVPGVFLHCALFSYRDVELDEWWKLVGLSTCPRHEKHHSITAANNYPDHPVMKGFPPLWITPKGELYKICKVWPKAQILAWGVAGEKKIHPVIWTNQYGKARIFSTTIGHHNETVETDVYLDLVTRGVLWAANKIDEDGEPREGYGFFSKLTSGFSQ